MLWTGYHLNALHEAAWEAGCRGVTTRCILTMVHSVAGQISCHHQPRICLRTQAGVTHHNADADDRIELAAFGHGLGYDGQLKAAGHPDHLQGAERQRLRPCAARSG
jgi:hypothetical protein